MLLPGWSPSVQQDPIEPQNFLPAQLCLGHSHVWPGSVGVAELQNAGLKNVADGWLRCSRFMCRLALMGT